MTDPNTIQPIVPPVVDSKPIPSPNVVATVASPTVVPSTSSPLVIRAQNPSRNIPQVPKVDATARPLAAPSSSPDQRDQKGSKDISKPDEVSEYINHGIDPSAPIYEITHAIPDALILKCADCQRFARVQPNLSGMELLPGPGDRGVQFKCSRCGGGQQSFKHTEKTWLEITLTSLYNLELQDKHKEGRRFFHVRQEICSFADRNWEVICLGRTRTPTWWATLNAQITTRTDLFETSKHGSGNWALRHSNITHPVQPTDMSSLDPAKEFPPEKSTTAKLNATAIVSKKVIGDRRFYLVTLEGNNGTVWRESTHPSFKSGELVRKFTKVDPVKEGNGTGSTSGANGGSAKAKSATSRAKSGSKGSGSANGAAYVNQYSTQTPLGVTLGVFTEKVVKAPSRLSRRQQSKHDAALAAANAAATSTHTGLHPLGGSGPLSYSNGGSAYANGMSTTTNAGGKLISPMADAYRKTSKAAAGLLDSHSPGPRSRSSPSSSSTSTSSSSSLGVPNSSSLSSPSMQHHQHQQQHHHHSYASASTSSSTSTAMSTSSYSTKGPINASHHSSINGAASGPLMSKLGSNGQQQLNLLPASSIKLGQNPQPMRCHQCNRRQLSRPKPGQEFVFCTRTLSKVEGDMTLSMACTSSYCLTCIELIYHEHPLDSDDLSGWICPACRKICTCATCNHYVDPSGQTQTHLVVTSSTPTAQLQQQQQQQQQQYQYQMQQQQQRSTYPAPLSGSVASANNAIPNAYGESSESPGEDSSSTTTASYGSAHSAKSTPTGSVSLSPNVSTWAPGVAPNGAPGLAGGVCYPGSGKSVARAQPKSFDKTTDFSKALNKSPNDATAHSKSESQYQHYHHLQHHHQEEYGSTMKIVIPAAYESSPSHSHSQPRKDSKSNVMSNSPSNGIGSGSGSSNGTVPQPSPHNTRSNSGSRSSSQHPLSLYTQSLVSRGPSNRKRGGGSSSTSPSSAVDLRASAPIHMPANLHQMRPHPQHSSFVSTTMPESMSSYPMMHNGHHLSMNGSSDKSVAAPRRRMMTESLAVSTTHNGSMAYSSLPSPSSELIPNDHRMFMSKGKRPHSDLSASTGDLARPRRALLLDSMEPSGKRRALVHTSMDDMGDLMNSELQSPRLSHFAEDEDDPHHPSHHHHHAGVGIHHHHHSLDDSMGKEVGDGIISAPQLGGEDDHTPIIIHSQPPPVVPTTSINPAQIMMAEYFDQPGMDGVEGDAHASWTDAPISVNNFESPYF